MNAQQMLNQLSDYQAQRDYLNLKRQELIDASMPAEVKARLAEINAEFDDKARAVVDNITYLEQQVKAAVLEGGATVKGASLMACWTKPRVTWDSKLLDGYAVAHPEILAARKEGEASVSIRKV